ncbi:hypothetical protein JMJ77_0014604, partial [Colletotrichum scovillei]
VLFNTLCSLLRPGHTPTSDSKSKVAANLETLNTYPINSDFLAALSLIRPVPILRTAHCLDDCLPYCILPYPGECFVLLGLVCLRARSSSLILLLPSVRMDRYSSPQAPLPLSNAFPFPPPSTHPRRLLPPCPVPRPDRPRTKSASVPSAHPDPLHFPSLRFPNCPHPHFLCLRRSHRNPPELRLPISSRLQSSFAAAAQCACFVFFCHLTPTLLTSRLVV